MIQVDIKLYFLKKESSELILNRNFILFSVTGTTIPILFLPKLQSFSAQILSIGNLYPNAKVSTLKI